MPTCIYCKSDSSSSVSIPHVMPEAFGSNGLVLPVGTECDRCNAYAGKRLEVNLIRYPDIAFAIQLLGTPGKKGKTRDEIGGFGRKRVDSEHVRLNFKVRGRLEVGPDGKRTIKGRVPPVDEFAFLRFRRALHHIGLNFVAADQGADVALQAKYDAVRRYVKDPRPASDSWAYGQVTKPQFERAFGVGWAEGDGIDFIGIHVFQTVFLVDLENTGRLLDAMNQIRGTFVPADQSEPPETTISAGDR